MSEKRFTIKPQDDYWAVVDNYNDDKVCIINGIHTEIEAIWLCDLLNTLHQQNQHLQDICTRTEAEKEEYADKYNELQKNFDDLTKMASETSKRNVELWERIAELQTQLKQKQEEEQLYAQEILRLKKTNEQALQFKTLGGDY